MKENYVLFIIALLSMQTEKQFCSAFLLTTKDKALQDFALDFIVVQNHVQ